MKKLLLALILFLALPPLAEATTRYVIVSAGSTGCSNGSTNYDPTASAGAGACGGGGTATVYFGANINTSAIAGSACSDTLEVRAGTYTTAIDDTSITWPATSSGCVFTIKNYLAEAPLFAKANGASLSQTKTTTSYTVFDGLSFASTGDFNEVAGIQGNNITIKNFALTANGLTVTQPNSGNVLIMNAASHHNLITRGTISNPGVGPGCGILSCDGYLIYNSGDDNTFEYITGSNGRAYGFHNYHQDGSHSSRNVFRYNRLTGLCQTLSTCSAILLGTGLDNKAYGNVIEATTGTSSGLLSAIHAGNSSIRSLVYNNTITGSKYACLSWDNSTTGTVVKNNICWTNTRDFYNSSTGDTTAPPSGTISTNRGDSAGSGISTTASPAFVDSSNHNFSLVAGSAMIDAGTASIASGVTACANGSAPDLGAIESLGTPTATVNGTAMVVTVVNNCTLQVLPATAVTGFTAKKNAVSDTVNANVRSGSNSYAITLNSAFVGGDTCLFSYSQTGNATSDNNIGNATTSNQEIFAFTDSSCTNISGGGGGSVGLSHWRVYLLQGATDTAWTAKCAEDSTNCTVAPGAKLWIRFKLRNNSGSNYPAFNLSPRWRHNGGAYATLTSANYVNGIKSVGVGAQVGTVVSDATTLTADQLTSNETSNVACVAIRSTNSIPALTLNDASEAECAQSLDISTAAVAGDTKEMCPFDDVGTALTCATPVKITIGNNSGAR